MITKNVYILQQYINKKIYNYRLRSITFLQIVILSNTFLTNRNTRYYCLQIVKLNYTCFINRKT